MSFAHFCTIVDSNSFQTYLTHLGRRLMDKALDEHRWVHNPYTTHSRPSGFEFSTICQMESAEKMCHTPCQKAYT